MKLSLKDCKSMIFPFFMLIIALFVLADQAYSDIKADRQCKSEFGTGWSAFPPTGGKYFNCFGFSPINSEIEYKVLKRRQS